MFYYCSIFARTELTQTLQKTYEVGCDVAPLEDGMLLIDAVCTSDVTGLINKWITLLVKLIQWIIVLRCCYKLYNFLTDQM